MRCVLLTSNRLVIKQVFKRILTGITVPQEYVCVDKNKFETSPKVFLQKADGSGRIDVTNAHVFLGYKPVIFAIQFDGDGGVTSPFENESLLKLEFVSGNDHLAFLAIEGKQVIRKNKSVIVIYQAVHGAHVFLNRFHRIFNQLRSGFKKTSKDNVSLPGNLYDQVRIAYCIPRVISVITVQRGDQMNMFPTDLHGQVAPGYYMSSLRAGGLANEQVQSIGKIVLSDVTASSFREVYNLGTNHMRKLEPVSNFACSGRSGDSGTPLPSSAVLYRELELESSFDVGIHRIHLYKIMKIQATGRDDSLLAHIHQYYAQWRINHRVPTEMLIR